MTTSPHASLIDRWPELRRLLQEHQKRALRCLVRVTLHRQSVQRLISPHMSYGMQGPIRGQELTAFTGYGFILAHDMGLGKTVTAIAFLCVANATVNACQLDALHRTSHPRLQRPFTVLVVCPKAACEQWSAELRRWWPMFNSGSAPDVALPGFSAERHRLRIVQLLAVRDSVAVGGLSEAHNVFMRTVEDTATGGGGAVVGIITYEMLQSLNHALGTFRGGDGGGGAILDVLLLDEAHRMQREGTYLYEAARGTAAHCKLCLSGYPIQNNVREFYVMLRLVEPPQEGLFPQRWPKRGSVKLPSSDEFEMHIAQILDGAPLLFRELSRLQDTDPRRNALLRSSQWTAVMGAIAALRRVARGRCHRVTAATIGTADLPVVDIVTVWCTMSTAQRAAYQCIERATAQHGSLATSAWLSMVCAHPCIVARWIGTLSNAGEPEQDEEDAELDPKGMPESLLRAVASFNGTTIAILRDLAQGAKMAMVVDLVLRAVQQGGSEKTVVFSHYYTTITVFVEMLQQEGARRGASVSDAVVVVTGGSTTKQRCSAIDRFQDSASPVLVFAATTRAAGVALNLTAASRLILIDCHWNPVHEIQALHRCVRLGMAGRRVTVTRFICAATHEEALRDVQRGKECVLHEVLDTQSGLSPSPCEPSSGGRPDEEDDPLRGGLLQTAVATWRSKQWCQRVSVERPSAAAAHHHAPGCDIAESDDSSDGGESLDRGKEGGADEEARCPGEETCAPPPSPLRKRRRFGRSEEQTLLAALRNRHAAVDNATKAREISVDDVKRMAALRAEVASASIPTELAALLDNAAAALR